MKVECILNKRLVATIKCGVALDCETSKQHLYCGTNPTVDISLSMLTPELDDESEGRLTSPALWLRWRLRCCRWARSPLERELCRGSRGSMKVVVRQL